MNRPLDHLLQGPPQEPAVTTQSREQGCYSLQKQEQTKEGKVQELEEPGREQGSDSSQKQEQTEKSEEQELEEPDRYKDYQVKDQEYKEQENPGGTAHTKTKDNREFYMELEEHDEEQVIHLSKGQEQTE